MKQAAVAVPPPPVPGDLINQKLPQLMMQLFLGTAAGGAALRGAYGIGRTINRNLSPPRSALSRQFPVYIPAPPKEEEEKLAAQKQAMPSLRDAGQWLTDQATGLMGDAADRTGNFLGNVLSGRESTSLWNHPYSILGLGTAAVGGGMAGWKLTDWIMDRQRKQQMQAELDAAKGEYEQAMLPTGSKAASELGQALDELHAACVAHEKQATAGETAGFIANLYTTALPLAALGSGMLTYNMMRSSQDKRKMLENASRQRARRLLTGGPVFAYPEMVPAEPEAKSAAMINTGPGLQAEPAPLPKVPKPLPLPVTPRPAVPPTAPPRAPRAMAAPRSLLAGRMAMVPGGLG